MRKTSKVNADPGKGYRGNRPMVQRNISIPSPRLVATPELMGSGQGLAVPQLDGIPLEHTLSTADEPCIALAKTLLRLDIGVPEDWEKAKRDPTAYVWLTLTRWVAAHGGEAIKKRFDLTTAITSNLDEYGDRDSTDGNLLYLAVDSDRSGYVLFGPTLELLEKIHPRLPVTFYNLFMVALNKWVRIYDLRDAQERVMMLREWIEGDPDEEQYEIPDVEGCIPPCMKRRPLSARNFQQMLSRAKSKDTKEILRGVIDLAQISKRADRPELTDEMREEMSDMNPPLPGLPARWIIGSILATTRTADNSSWGNL